MIVHTIYAIIHDGEIKNTIICDDYTLANHIAHAAHGDTAIAVDVSRYAVGIGDKYHDGFFWRMEDGEETQIDPTPTEEEEVQSLKARLAEAEEQNTIMQLALVEMYESGVSV